MQFRNAHATRSTAAYMTAILALGCWASALGCDALADNEGTHNASLAGAGSQPDDEATAGGAGSSGTDDSETNASSADAGAGGGSEQIATADDDTADDDTADDDTADDDTADDDTADDDTSDDDTADDTVDEGVDLCQIADGSPVPYDYSRGLVDEYSFELSMSCELGGQVEPLFLADPEGLSLIMDFNAGLTDWYRAQVLECPEATPDSSAVQFGLLPSNEAGLSRRDVAAAIDLLLMVLDRHDGLDDAMTAEQKSVLRERLEAMGVGATTIDSDEPTMPLDPCPMPF